MAETLIRQIKQAADILFRPGDVVEVRVPKAGRFGTISGYFSDHARMAQEVARLEAQKFRGVYWTLNPVQPEALARADHQAVRNAKETTSDHEIVCRRWLPLDFDPKRLSGISSTAAEQDAAFALAGEVQDRLAAEGWGAPIHAGSGNGAHLLYRVDLPNDEESTALLTRVLQGLAARFGTVQVDIDRTMFNASRISKIYGTTARKGSDTADRPHRVSQLLYVPESESISPVSVELLRAMAAHAPADARRGSPVAPARWPSTAAPFDLAAFLGRHGIRHRGAKSYDGGYKYVLDECPFDAAHKAPDAAVFEGAGGKLGFKCLHNSCADYGWREFRERFDGPRPVRPFPASRGSAAVAASPASDPEAAASDESDKNLPLGAADVEAAIAAACAADDLEAALRLIPSIARIPYCSYALIESTLARKFKREFSRRTFKAAVDQERAQQATPPPLSDEDSLPDDGAPDLITGIPLTDSGNGERIVKLYGEDIRFCPEFKKWLLWDGRRWRIDTDAATVTQYAKNMARLLHKQGSVFSDETLGRLVKTHARDSESQGAISAALLRAKSEPGMSVSAAELDMHRYLLNCLNGVVDVRTGELLPYERRYYITKLCHVNYRPESNPEKDCPRFLKQLYWAMGETPDMAELPERVTRMVGFLQKSFGYALTGDVSEKAAFIFYGSKGNNGKTTLLTIFKTILSEYAAQLDINTLMTSKFTDNNVRADLAKLHGARFVITSEVDDGQKLSERLMKYLTAGMGEITACRKFENPFEFTATHKIFMDCNYRPEIKGADEAIWARLKCVPFLQRIDKNDPNIDKQLVEKILAEAEGILAWAVRGAVRWKNEHSLGDPVEVAEAVAEWRDADDPLKGFFEEACEVEVADPHCWVRCTDFTKAYQAWCKDNNEPQLKSSKLTQRLALKGITLNRSRRVSDAGKQARCWDGVRLVDDVTLISAPRHDRPTGDR